MIDTTAKLNGFAPRLRDAAWVGLDTEADSLHAFPEKVCLIQISIPGEDVLLDPLAGTDLTAVWAALMGKEIVLHGADYDLRMLYRTYRFVPTRVFDTMVAARLLGIARFGLTDLLARFFGVRLDKAPQKANWARRPLTDRMIAYALNDSRYLHPLAEMLGRQLADKGRDDWHRQACEQLIRDCTRPSAGPPADAWRVKGSHRLGRRALAVLRSLHQWREREAIASNRPPFFILGHDALVTIAERAAAHHSYDLFVPARFSQRRSYALREVVAQAMALGESDVPHPPCPQGRRQTMAERHRLSRLRHRRDRQAAELGLEPALIASRSMLVSLAHNWEANAAQLLPWQRELLSG